MVSSCAAVGCTNRFRKGSGITFHNFPVDKRRCLLWTKALRRIDFVGTRNSTLCSEHFRKEDFVFNFGRRSLKKDCVPSIFKFPRELCLRQQCPSDFVPSWIMMELQRLQPETMPSEWYRKNPTTGLYNTYCSVPGCNSQTTLDNPIRFHFFPKPCQFEVKVKTELGTYREIDGRDYWIQKTKIGSKISKRMRICFLHFSHEDYEIIDNVHRLKQNAVPTLNLPRGPNYQPTNENLQERHGTKLMATSTQRRAYLSPLLMKLQSQNSLKLKRIRIVNSIDTDSKLKYLTGLPSFEILETIINLLKRQSFSRREGAALRENIMLTFCKLKTDCSYVNLGCLFGISARACRTTIYETIPVLAHVMKQIIQFPLKISTKANVPSCLPQFSNIPAILDCIEIKTEPRLLNSRRSSPYRDHSTVKFLIAVSTGGLVAFIGDGHDGNVSNRVILKNSGLINMLDHSVVPRRGGALVIVDRGFGVDDLSCDGFRVELFKPVMTKRADARVMAQAQTHFERVYQGVKKFQILKGTLKLPLVKLVHEIFTIACAVENLSLSEYYDFDL